MRLPVLILSAAMVAGSAHAQGVPRLPREQFDDSTPLRIKGEVDRRWNQRQRYIDVKSVQIVR